MDKVQRAVKPLTDQEYISYVEFTRTTAKYPSYLTGNKDELSYLTLGLFNEFTEYMNAVDLDMLVSRRDRHKELGDVCWYLFRLFDVFDFKVGPSFTPIPLTPGNAEREFIKASGKLAGRCKKFLRDGTAITAAEAIPLLAKCYCALERIARYDATSIASLTVLNQAKLQDRVKRGVLFGSGDHR